jgi:hypothetical protein
MVNTLTKFIVKEYKTIVVGLASFAIGFFTRELVEKTKTKKEIEK